MTKWIVLAVVVAGVVAGAYFEGGRRANETAIRKVEDAKLQGAREARVQAATEQARDRQTVTTLKREIVAHKAETARLRGVAGEYAKEVAAVRVAGTRLVDTGTPDEIMAALTARGYHPQRCRAVPVVR